MPRALEPGQKFRYVLKSDQDKPEEEQPAFFLRALSGRQWREIAGEQMKALDKAREANDAGEILLNMFGILRLGVRGWEHMTDPDTEKDIPFDPESIDLLLDPIEGGELLDALLTGQVVSPEDKKKSESPASSRQESSANGAALAGAKTRRQR